MGKGIAVCAALCAGLLAGQTQVNLGRQGKNVDFRPATTYPFQTGTALPSQCGAGQVFFKTDAAPGQNVFLCYQANTWISAGTAVTILAGGVEVAQKSVLDFSAGSGLTVSVADTGGTVAVVPSVDTANLLTRSAAQAGGVWRCLSEGASGLEYTCRLLPTLTMYTAGMLLYWVPDVANESPSPTLNVDMLGARALKPWEGSGEFRAGEIEANKPVPVWYDGAAFRVLSPPTPVGVGETRPECTAARQGRLWLLPGAEGAADQLAICAKDDMDAFVWRTF